MLAEKDLPTGALPIVPAYDRGQVQQHLAALEAEAAQIAADLDAAMARRAEAEPGVEDEVLVLRAAIEAAFAELGAVRAVLDDVAGPRDPLGFPEDEAIRLSRQIVEQMRAPQGPTPQAEVDAARQLAEERVIEASRRFAPAAFPPPPRVPEPITWRATEDDVPHWTTPLPELQHWAEPAPVVPPAEVRAPVSTPARQAAREHEEFWREAAAAPRTTGLSLLDVLLPTAALLLFLIIVLALIG